MKTNGNDTAYPVSQDVLYKKSQGHFNNAGEAKPFGLTKLELFASRNMQALLSNPETNIESLEKIADDAVRSAHILISALNNRL